MFATVTRVQVQPGKAEEGHAFWQETLLPALRQQKGFRGVLVLHDPQSEKGMSVSLWDSPEDSRLAHAAILQQLSDRLYTMIASGPDMEGYNVSFNALS